MVNEEVMKRVFELIAKEIEFRKEIDRKKGIDVDSPDYEEPIPFVTITHLKSFENYRAIRTEEAYTSMVLKDSDKSSREKREILVELDKQRRSYHNSALGGVNGLNFLAKKFNLPPIYQGRELTSEEIEKHANLGARKEYTDFFLDLINEIENLSIKSIEEKENSNVVQGIRTVKDEIYGNIRKWGVKDTLKEDDGDITFEDFE